MLYETELLKIKYLNPRFTFKILKKLINPIFETQYY